MNIVDYGVVIRSLLLKRVVCVGNSLYYLPEVLIIYRIISTTNYAGFTSLNKSGLTYYQIQISI